MSRHRYLAVSALSSIAIGSIVLGLDGEALAQPGRPGAPAMAAPHVAAPAPHMAAPAPHMAAPAPHFAAPHMAAPAPHMAPAPHLAAPARRFAEHAAPQPHFAAPRGAPHGNFARIEHGHGAPQQGHVASEASRHVGGTPAARELSRHAPTPSTEAAKSAL